MSEANGAGMPAIITYMCKSGIVCHIQPINVALLRAIQLQGQERYPYPNKADYPVELPGSFVSDEMRQAAEIEAAPNNPEYIQACKAIDAKRDDFERDAILNIAVRFVQYANEDGTFEYHTEETLVNHFAAQLMKMRKYAKLAFEDDYQATVWYCVFSGDRLVYNKATDQLTAFDGDFAYVRQLAIQQLPLSHVEVMAGVRYFPYTLPGATT